MRDLPGLQHTSHTLGGVPVHHYTEEVHGGEEQQAQPLPQVHHYTGEVHGIQPGQLPVHKKKLQQAVHHYTEESHSDDEALQQPVHHYTEESHSDDEAQQQQQERHYTEEVHSDDEEQHDDRVLRQQQRLHQQHYAEGSEGSHQYTGEWHGGAEDADDEVAQRVPAGGRRAGGHQQQHEYSGETH